MDVKPFTFSYEELKQATNDFNSDNKLGEGGFGPVYKVSHYFIQVYLSEKIKIRIEHRVFISANGQYRLSAFAEKSSSSVNFTYF